MIREIFNLAILNAFKMDPADTSYPLSKRVGGKRLALLNWGPSAIKISFATKENGKFEVSPEQQLLPATTPVSQVIDMLKQRTDCGCVALLYSAVNLFCETQSGGKVPTGLALEAKLRNDPKGLVGSAFEEDKAYQMLMSPDAQTRILFAVNSPPFKELEKSLHDAGLTVVRAQIAPYTLLNALLGGEDWSIAETPEVIMLPTVISQAHVIVIDYNGKSFSPEIFRATPLFLDKTTESPEFVEQLRNFFLTCAENAILSKKIIGKKVVFKWVDSGTVSEAGPDLSSYLSDRIDVGFEKWKKAKPNTDFEALLEN